MTDRNTKTGGRGSPKISPRFTPKGALHDIKKGGTSGAMSSFSLGPSATESNSARKSGDAKALAHTSDEFDNISIPNVTGLTPEISPMLQPKTVATDSDGSSSVVPSVSLMLQNDKKTTVGVKDVSNLALWGLNPTVTANGDTSGMLVDSPKWALLKARHKVKHVAVVYLNGITYEQVLGSTQLAQLLLKPLRRAEFIPKPQNSASGASLMATAYGGGGSSSGSSSSVAAADVVQIAPLWVNSTKNNLEHDFFFRYERRQQYSNSNGTGAGGGGGGGRGGDSGPSQNFNNRSDSQRDAVTGAPDSPGGSPQVPPSRRELDGANAAPAKTKGVSSSKFFVDMLRRASKDGGVSPPKSPPPEHKSPDFKPTEKVKAHLKQHHVCKWTTREDHKKPRLSWTDLVDADRTSAATVDKVLACGVEGVDMVSKWTVALDATLVPESPSLGPGGTFANPDPKSVTKGGGEKGGKKSKSPGVHLEDLVMSSREDLNEHGFLFQYPIQLPGSSSSPPNELVPFRSARLDAVGSAPPTTKDTQQFAVALDCEMVMTDEGSTLARLTVVAVPSGACLVDMLVKPKKPVTDYVTRYSGITEEMLVDCPFTLEDAQRRLQGLIAKKYTYVLGHGLENDFLACRMDPTDIKILDTTFLFPHVSGLPLKNSLKFLMNRYFGRSEFQQGEHDSAEDATACIELVGLKLRRGVEYGRPRRNNILGTPNLSRESAVTCAIIDRGQNCARLTPHKASHCFPLPCIDDDDVTKKAQKYFWKLRLAESQAAEELAKATKKGNLEGFQQDPLPCSFTWLQLKDCYFPEVDPFVLQKLKKMHPGASSAVDGWQPPSKTEAVEAAHHEVTDDKVPGKEDRMTATWLERIVDGNDAEERKQTQRILRGKVAREKERVEAKMNKRGKRDRFGAGEADSTAKSDPVPKEDEGADDKNATTVTMEIHKLNLRLGAIINAAPHKTLVLVMASNCREGALNQMSSAHGALFAFVKDENNYSLLPQDMVELQTHLQEQEAQAKSCAPQ